jgi:hypothetical protein
MDFSLCLKVDIKPETKDIAAQANAPKAVNAKGMLPKNHP